MYDPMIQQKAQAQALRQPQMGGQQFQPMQGGGMSMSLPMDPNGGMQMEMPPMMPPAPPGLPGPRGPGQLGGPMRPGVQPQQPGLPGPMGPRPMGGQRPMPAPGYPRR